MLSTRQPVASSSRARPFLVPKSNATSTQLNQRSSAYITGIPFVTHSLGGTSTDSPRPQPSAPRIGKFGGHFEPIVAGVKPKPKPKKCEWWPYSDSDECTDPHSMEVFPIHDAARRGNLERVRQLIYDDDGNVRWDAHEDDEDGAIPLHYAAKYNHVEVARLLLDAGSNVNEIEELGTTPLQYAASTGSVEMTMLLLERGADQSVGDSALDEAIRTGHHAVAEILSRWNNVSV